MNGWLIQGASTLMATSSTVTDTVPAPVTALTSRAWVARPPAGEDAADCRCTDANTMPRTRATPQNVRAATCDFCPRMATPLSTGRDVARLAVNASVARSAPQVRPIMLPLPTAVKGVYRNRSFVYKHDFPRSIRRSPRLRLSPSKL